MRLWWAWVGLGALVSIALSAYGLRISGLLTPDLAHVAEAAIVVVLAASVAVLVLAPNRRRRPRRRR